MCKNRDAATTANRAIQNRHGTRVDPLHAIGQSYEMHLGGPEGVGRKLMAEAHARGWSRTGLKNILPLRAALMSKTLDAFWHKVCP